MVAQRHVYASLREVSNDLTVISQTFTRSVAQSCLTVCDPMDCRMRGFSVLHYLPEFAMTQQSHSWVYILRKPYLKETHVPQCSLQHCL